MSAASPEPKMRDRRGRVYTPAIGSRLRPWLWSLLIGFALLAANGAYLASVTFLGWLRGGNQQTYFSLLMLAAHLAFGVIFVTPFVVFGVVHWATSRNRPNKAAIRFGLMLLAAATILMITGFALWREFIDLRDPKIRQVVYWLHVITPLAAIALYMQHRFAGPRIKWHFVRAWVGAVAAFIAVMAVFHSHDPRAVKRSSDPRYTYPSEVKLAGGKLISEDTLMMDEYCLKCHKDSYDGWYHSAHHFSSFNNKPYLASVRETRKVAKERDNDVHAARFCAGCHDPVPFFSGAFDDPNYDDVNSRSSQAGITCTTCHAITHINSTRGNADYTIEEPQHYPFAQSTNPALQWLNNTLVRAKPEMHKKTFLKADVHKNAAFCATCHKVNLPYTLNHYKDFLRGQNHWDNFVLSGVAGGNAKSFYYPPNAEKDCNGCHMPLKPSNDFGAQDFDGIAGREVHDHLFPGANTGLATIRGRVDIAEEQAKFLAEKQVRIDIFGLRDNGSIDGNLTAPLRPEVPVLETGKNYLVETVVRTLHIAHLFSQGTVDSNEIWVELLAKADGKIIGRSGGIDESGQVDPYSHFINVYMLDRTGKRIDRRNAQDIFVPLYNKQVPPGAGQIVHFNLNVPPGLQGPITLEARVNYRKFDRTYMDYVFGKGKGPELPVVVMASDKLELAVQGGQAATNQPSTIKDEWQRWNDYGIGLLLEGGTKGANKGELKQAEAVFEHLAEKYEKPDGWVNLARVYLKEGRNQDALRVLAKATEMNFAAPWVINWLSAQVDDREGNLDSAIARYRDVLGTKIPARGFDFGRDYEVRNALGRALWGRYHQEDPASTERDELLADTIATFQQTLMSDSENVDAHYGLSLAYAELARRAAVAGQVDSARVRAAASTEPLPTPEQLNELAAQLGTAAGKAGETAEKAAKLNADLLRFVDVKAERPAFGSRPITLLKVSEQVASACLQAPDPATKAALASVLATCHSALHGFYKPDETAEGIAQATARRDNPAADFNANSVVIHDLHRPGAPGIDAKATPTANANPSAASPGPVSALKTESVISTTNSPETASIARQEGEQTP